MTEILRGATDTVGRATQPLTQTGPLKGILGSDDPKSVQTQHATNPMEDEAGEGTASNESQNAKKETLDISDNKSGTTDAANGVLGEDQAETQSATDVTESQLDRDSTNESSSDENDNEGSDGEEEEAGNQVDEMTNRENSEEAATKNEPIEGVNADGKNQEEIEVLAEEQKIDDHEDECEDTNAENGSTQDEETEPKDERTPDQAIEEYKAELQRQADEETKTKQEETDKQNEEESQRTAEQAQKDADLANQISDVVQSCLDRIKPVLTLIKEQLDKADRDRQNDELDEDKVVSTVKPLIEQATSILQECWGGVKGLDPSGKLAKRSQAKASERNATPEEYRLADLLKELTENVTKTVEEARRRIQDMPKAKKDLGPLLNMLQDPLFQILAAVGLLLNGVLGLLGNLLSGLGLGGIVNKLLGGIGLDKALKGLGLGKLLGGK